MNAVMRREIFGQPQLMTSVLPELRASVGDLNLGSRRVWAGGCGDGTFVAGAASRMFFDAGVDYRPATAHELAFQALIGVGDQMILISISGGTKRTVQAARRAQAIGARSMAITCNPDSALAKACDQVLLLPFQPMSRSTPHTADYIVSLLALGALAERFGQCADETLDDMPSCVDAVLSQGDAVALALAQAWSPTTKLFVLGQGSNLFTAQYIAAKFHESGGLVALAAETENFVHGANFMVEPGDIVCLIGNDGPGDFRAVELIPGLTELSAKVVFIGAATLPGAPVVKLAVPPTRPSMTVFPSAVAGQLVCLTAVESFGLAVEQPRAGRLGATVHGDVQRRWMTETPDDIEPLLRQGAG